MAKKVLGMATSHGPMLSTPWEQWGARVAADRQNSAHPFQGGTYDFDTLVGMRKSENLAAQITPEKWRSRHAACHAALEVLAATYTEAAPDVAVIVGNDQRELFTGENNPAFAIYWGATIENRPRTAEQIATLPPGIAIAERGHAPPEDATYPGQPELGRHIMKDRVIPNVPVFLNTFYPPNQPSAARCRQFGEALGRAIESWDSDARIAVFGSGGLSHFVIDEQLDREVLEAFRTNDMERLVAIPDTLYQSGTSEIKNWIPLAAMMAEGGRDMTLVDYVPCYRSEAGTGNAMGFAYWQ